MNGNYFYRLQKQEGKGFTHVCLCAYEIYGSRGQVSTICISDFNSSRTAATTN